ncbi:uncharacterized protein L3040_001065 [Drepanopeziza brunnea f. sp. 'multigermtubi']|uniref:uncharacterized protein n=1 Tax=Drepanopeziza brunnea f. sp. 'multigermtubi' TaxID=698441 RepID=UPI0023A5C4A8|nr:hypothetical protein L3040_001065 [Drepanopeziza brunnea f. sp. 'multigermtubi']
MPVDPNGAETSAAGAKRKRTPAPDEGRQSVPPMQHAGVGPPINYLSKAKPERLRLIEGDSETFGDVLGMIDDYEGVLQRQESLAANLGAKLVGPLLLKSFEKLFDGPIKTITPYAFGVEQTPVSWLEIVTYARTNPADFVLTETIQGFRACRFWIKGGQVEISEDDWRLIMSGGPERMIPTQPLAEDEAAELGTLNILETRLAMLIKKADAVASKARQLNYQLKGRKTAVLNRKSAEQPLNPDPENRNFTPAPFSVINARSNGEAKMQQNLLDQFTSLDRRQSAPHGRPRTSRTSAVEQPTFHSYGSQEPDTRRLSQPLSSCEDGTEGQYRVLMASKIEKLSRGDPVYPPCDRCRRLNFECTKHLTACQACTKKHAKCAWKEIKEGELDHVPLMLGLGNGISQTQIQVDSSLELGLRTGPDGGFGAGDGQQQQHTHPMMVDRESHGDGQREREWESGRERDRGVENEHAMLTRIAAAAAGR